MLQTSLEMQPTMSREIQSPKYNLRGHNLQLEMQPTMSRLGAHCRNNQATLLLPPLHLQTYKSIPALPQVDQAKTSAPALASASL